MKKKKGFTLVELLVAIVIIAVLSGIGVISYRSIFTTAEERYYNAIESNLLLAGNDYFEDHRDILPVGSEYSSVSLVDLIGYKYIEEVVDTEGNLCSEGTVYAYRENNKFRYEACIECGRYKSDGKYCSGPAQRKITVTAKKAISNESYSDIEKSYNKAGYSNGENIIVTFSMNSEYSVKQYKVYNTRTEDEPLACSVSSGTSCSVELNKSGTYRVVALDEDNKEISSKYINAKIAKGPANFTLDVENKYLISKNDCDKNKTTKKLLININKIINEDYESVKYQIYTDPNNKGEFKEPHGLRIEEELESGHYTIDVIVKNYSDVDERMVTKVFDISYLIDVTYEDGDTPITHEVVKGQTYNYLNSLPETKLSYGQELEIRWFNGETQINPGETLVSNDCTFTIVGKTAIPVNVENFATYCNKDTGVNGLKYTGSELTLTNTPPANVTFTNNKGTAVNTYSVKAHIQTPLYIWNDGTTADKTFNCSIVKGDNPMTVTDNQTWNVSYSPNNQTKTITGAANAAGTVTYTISSQPSGNKFSLSGTTLTMAGGTGTGTHTIVINAHADGNGSYNSVDKTFTITVSVGVVPNRMTVTTPQTWNPTFSSSAQDKAFTGAASADGAVTYSIPTDKNNATIRGYFSIPTSSTASLRMAANTPSGTYAVVVRAHAAGSGGYEAGDKDITINVTVGAQACNAPASVTIGTDGKITWPASTNCSGATYQIKIGSGSYEDATSGVNKYDALTASAGTKTVCVKTIKLNNNYSNSAELCVDKNVYSVTLTKGTGISAVTGSGKNHIAGETVSIDATVSSGYTWSKWTQTSGGSQVSTTKAYSGTISSNWAYTANATANTYTITYNANGGSGAPSATTYTYATSGTVSLSSTKPTKAGYNFLGWSTSSTATSATYAAGASWNKSNASDTTLYAVWSAKPIQIYYHPNNGSVTASGYTTYSSRVSQNGTSYFYQTINSGGNSDPYNYTTFGITRTGYSVPDGTEWCTNNSGGGTCFDHDVKYTYDQYKAVATEKDTYYEVLLYTHWTINKIYLRYNVNGGSWAGSTNTNLGVSDSFVTYNGNSTTVFAVDYNGTINLADYNNASYINISKTGYTAVSGKQWCTGTSGNGTCYNHSTDYANAGTDATASTHFCDARTSSCTVTLYVNWAPNTYKITLDNQSATSAGTTEVWYQYNTTKTISGTTCYYYTNSSLTTCLSGGYTITKPSKNGYIFGGYYTEANGAGTQYVNASGNFVNNAYKTTGNKTLKAKWTAKTTPTLTMSATSGTVVKGKTLTFKIKSNVAGTFTFSSNATGKATVSPASQSAAANTEYTVTVTGVADGSATITCSFTPSDTTNYNTASKTYTATITKSATIPTTSYCKSLTYNGSSQTLVNTAGTGYTWTAGTTRTDAGSQNVTATLSSGYRWSDNGTGTKTISCSIGQATPSFAKTESSKSIYKDRSDTYGLIPNVAGKITSSTSNSGVATVSQASNCSSIGANAQCVITVTGKAVGSATMTHTFTPTSSNYKSVSTTMPVTILNNAFTVTFAGVNPISTSFDGSTVTLAGSAAVPAYASSTLSLAANTNYVVSFDYKCASGSNQFDVDFYPDSLPQTNPTATTTLQHMDWITSSSNSAMGSTQLRFFDDFQASNESDITITNIMLSRTSTKTVYYGSAYGDLPAPTRSGYTFNGWYTASNGGTQITSSSTVSTTANHTLYARWTKTTCCPSGGWYNGGYCYTGSIGNTGEGTCRNLSGYYWISNNCYSSRYGASC